jgi:ribosomal protein L24
MRFRYLDKVSIIDGFYKGQTGVVLKYISASQDQISRLYSVKISADLCVDVEEEHLKHDRQ